MLNGEDIFTSVVLKIATSKFLRKPLWNQFDKKLYSIIVEKNESELKAVQMKKYHYLKAMAKCALRNLDKGYISNDVAKKAVNVLVKNQLIRKDDSKKAMAEWNAKYGKGDNPPSFLLFSPTSKCNLKCTGCYADCDASTNVTLPYSMVEKVFADVHDNFGNRFMTISGGEPFMYKDNDKTLFDIWEKYSDMMFLVYTNGTLITKEVAERLAKLGNVTPAISVEGLEKETDERRGKGVFKRILEAFKNLREAGVPFGVSVTPTKKNFEILMNDEFYKFFFEEQGASYMWQFQLMPIGRGKDVFELTISPKQRMDLYHKWKDLLENKEYCVCDFWNSGLLTDGCIAYGRQAGYLYIDWDGKVMPCAFVPYYVDTLYDLYDNGKTLTDAVLSDFMTRGRQWQKEYGLNDRKNPHNWLMPCSIRDHYNNFRENILTKDAKPENKEAAEALESKEYRETLEKFDSDLEELSEPVWKEEYFSEAKN